MSLKSVALGIISFIIVSLLTIGLSFAGDFDPVMPTSEISIKPSGITTGSSPVIVVGDLYHHNMKVKTTCDQLQIVISSSTTTYYDGWFSLETHDQYPITVNIPIGTEYVVSVRGWNNNGFGEWVVSGLNTVVPKGTDCYSNVQTYSYPIQLNPACQ